MAKIGVGIGLPFLLIVILLQSNLFTESFTLNLGLNVPNLAIVVIIISFLVGFSSSAIQYYSLQLEKKLANDWSQEAERVLKKIQARFEETEEDGVGGIAEVMTNA